MGRPTGLSVVQLEPAVHPAYALRGRGRGWRHRWLRSPRLADVTEAVDAVDAVAAGDAIMLPNDDGVALTRDAATDMAGNVAGAAVPVRGGSARVGSIQSDSPKRVAHERGTLREPPGAVGFSAPTWSSPHISLTTGTDGALRCAPLPTPPAPQPSGRSSPERLRGEAAFGALQYAFSFEGEKVPSSVYQALLQAREWMHQVQQLDTTVTALHEASTAAERECIEHHVKLRGVQDILAVVSQRLVALPMSSSTVGATRPALEDAAATPPSPLLILLL